MAIKDGISGGVFGAVASEIASVAKTAGAYTLIEKAALYGAAGGISSVVQGADFKSGFLAAGFSTLAGPTIGEALGGGRIEQGIARAIVGGVASVLGGGKFANGAAYAAFAYVIGEISTDYSSSSGETIESQGSGGSVIKAAYPGDFHDAEVRDLADYISSQGGKVLTEVPLEMADGRASTRIDLFAQMTESQTGTSTIHTFGVEVKTGANPRFTKAQLIVYPHLMMGGSVISTTDRIMAFGFKPGQPLPPIPVYLMYRAGPTAPPIFRELSPNLVLQQLLRKR